MDATATQHALGVRITDGRLGEIGEWESVGAEAYLLRRFWRLTAADLARGCEHTRDWLDSEPFTLWATLTADLAPAEFAALLLVRYWRTRTDAAVDHTGGYARVLRMQGLLPRRQDREVTSAVHVGDHARADCGLA